MKKLLVFAFLGMMMTSLHGQTTTYYCTDGTNRLSQEELDEKTTELKTRFGKMFNNEMFIDVEITKEEIKGDSLIQYVKFNMSDRKTKTADTFAEFMGKPLKDNPIALNGKPTLVNFWFTNCPPCIDEMPVLNRIAKSYAEEYNFVAITYETKEKVDAFLKKVDFNFEHYTDAQAFIDQIGIQAYPVNLILDAEGNLKQVLGGIAYEGELGEELQMGDGEDLIQALKANM